MENYYEVIKEYEVENFYNLIKFINLYRRK